MADAKTELEFTINEFGLDYNLTLFSVAEAFVINVMNSVSSEIYQEINAKQLQSLIRIINQ